MKNQAIEKIKNQAGEDPVLQMMAQQISSYITTKTRAELVLADDKSLAGCKKAFDSHARKNKKDGMSIIGPKEAEDLIFEYFGFGSEDAEQGSENTIDLGRLLGF